MAAYKDSRPLKAINLCCLPPDCVNCGRGACKGHRQVRLQRIIRVTLWPLEDNDFPLVSHDTNLDVIDLGDPVSEAAHGFASDASDVTTAQLGDKARVGKVLDTAQIKTGELRFNLKVETKGR